MELLKSIPPKIWTASRPPVTSLQVTVRHHKPDNYNCPIIIGCTRHWNPTLQSCCNSKIKMQRCFCGGTSANAYSLMCSFNRTSCTRCATHYVCYTCHVLHRLSLSRADSDSARAIVQANFRR